VIATIHDAEMFKRHQWIKNRHLQHLKSWGRKKSLDWVSHFITISQAMIPELTQDCGIPEEKISVVYNGISSWWFEKVTAEVKNQTLAKLHLPEKFLLFVGTLNHRKNLPRLVKAYLALPSDIQQTYPLIVIGKAGWDSKESALAVQQLETKRAGRWLRYISDEDLRVLFQCASLYLHPSLHEGFGLTLLQSFASSTPVLTSNVAAMPEIADDAAYLVNPDSEEEIRAGMLKLLTSPSLCEDFIKKGDERVKQFSWEKTAKATLAVYDKIK